MKNTRDIGAESSTVSGNVLNEVSVRRLVALTTANFGAMYFLLAPQKWGVNERHYFSQALFATESNVGVFASGFPNNTNVLFQLVVRFASDLLTLEVAWFLFRHFGLLSLAIGLAIIGVALRLPLIVQPIALVIFVATGQAYFGGEWILNGFEAKIPAYAAGFSAIGLVLLNRWWLAWLLATVALLFHPLVGLFFMGAIPFFLKWERKKLNFQTFLPPLAFIIPSGFYLWALRSLGKSGDSSESERARAIYTLVRHPHHISPFDTTNPIDGKPIVGWFNFSELLLPASVLIGLVWVYSTTTDSLLRRATFAAIVLHAWIPLSLLISYLDRNEAYFGILYLFRPLSPLLLLSIILLLGGIFGQRLPSSRDSIVIALIIAWLLSGVPKFSFFSTEPVGALTPNGELTVKMIQENVDPQETVFVDFPSVGPSTGLTEENFELLVERGQIAIWKFVPTSDHDLLFWWSAIESRRQLASRACDADRDNLWDYGLFRASDLMEGYNLWVQDSLEDLVLIRLTENSLKELCR